VMELFRQRGIFFVFFVFFLLQYMLSFYLSVLELFRQRGILMSSPLCGRDI
jgi:hypothetical protein